MRKSLFLASIILWLALPSFPQVGINADNSTPHPSAGLDVKFENKGFLPPRMTFEQRNAIQNPIEGLIVFCTNCTQDGAGVLSMFQGGKWVNISWSCPAPNQPFSGTHLPDVTQIEWNWDSVPIASGYKIGSSGDYSSSLDLGNATSYTEQGLTCFTNYTRYLWAYNGCGYSDALPISQSTNPLPFFPAPTEGMHNATNTQIVWNWIPVPGATGYKWSNSDNFNSATDMGENASKTESGLSCGNFYTRFIWAYNSCGYSEPVSISQSTADCYPCNDSLNINHLILNGVAPIDKSVKYGMVTGIPGETGKCWITQNLGSSRQATSVNENTEASAGWYWQFNRKQGYRHDGTNRTPNTTWIGGISENLDWETAKDPCTLELGAPWRLPTYTEWNNVDNTGGWANMNGPWNSGLKIHAAGHLDRGNGLLYNRGLTGLYWSSIQYGYGYGRHLNFESGYCGMNSFDKSYGFSVRCIRDN